MVARRITANAIGCQLVRVASATANWIGSAPADLASKPTNSSRSFEGRLGTGERIFSRRAAASGSAHSGCWLKTQVATDRTYMSLSIQARMTSSLFNRPPGICSSAINATRRIGV